MSYLNFERPYGVRLASAAKYDPVTESWGTPVVVANIQTVEFTPEMVNTQGNVYGATEAMISYMRALDVTIAMLGIDAEADEVVSGRTSTSSDPIKRRRKTEARKQLPYVGWWFALDADNGLDLHVGVPYMRLNTYPPLAVDGDGNIVAPNVGAKAGRLRLSDKTSLYPVYDEKLYDAETALPTDFNTAFEVLA